MSNRGRKNRCINCSYSIPRNQSAHSLEQMSTPIMILLSSWITPTQLTSECVLCTECLTLIQDRVNTINEGSSSLPALGHRKVCFPCGNSILRATRTYPVREDQHERNILIRLVPLHLISRFERVCAACWRSATRKVQSREQQDSNYPGLSGGILTDARSNADLNISDPPPLTQLNYRIPQAMTNPKIISSVYRRAASTSNHCIFVNCFAKERLLVPLSIREQLLLKYRFYVPPAARVCRHHLDHGRWSELTSQLRDFTGSQFDIIMNMMQRVVHRKEKTVKVQSKRGKRVTSKRNNTHLPQ